VRWVIAVVVAATSITGTRAAAQPAPPDASTAPDAAAVCGSSPFVPELGAYLTQRWPGKRFTAAIHDQRTGCEYLYRPDLRITTASVFKIEVMAGVLLRAEHEGRGLTSWEADRVWPMITESANEPTSELYQYLGGTSGFAALNSTFGLSETQAAPPTWGLTSTSARDQVNLVRQVLAGEYGPLTSSYRDLAWWYMTNVVPWQRWGITAGVPAGWVVPLKNGFADSVCCGWRINSSGFVADPRGGGYAVTILTDGWAQEADGIPANEFLSRLVAANQSRLPAGPFPTGEAFVAQQYVDLFGRPADWLGKAAWTITTNAIGPAPVVASLMASPEHAPRDPVARLYLATFLRLPDLAGFDYWTAELVSGARTLAGAAGAFTGTDEFQARYGDLDDGGFVDLVYQNVLGRSPDDAGRAYWVDALATGRITRGDLMIGFSESPEFVAAHQREIDVLVTFRSMLQRLPDEASLDWWVDTMEANGWGRQQLIASVMYSSEYRARID
jgi:hypothetical protein